MGFFSSSSPQVDKKSTSGQTTPSPLAGLSTSSIVLIAACCTLPPYLILRRLGRIEASMQTLTKRSVARKTNTAEMLREMKYMREEVEMLKGRVEKVAGDVCDVRSIVLKERNRLTAIEGRFAGLSEELDRHQKNTVASVCAEQKRFMRIENNINELRKTAVQNTESLSKLAVSLADIAGSIDQTEIEHGVLPEQGKESSKRVNALRDTALDALQSAHNKPC